MATKVTMQTNTRTTTHTIDMHGVSGGVFGCVLVGLIVYIVAYATPSWYTNNNTHIGIWEGCTCYGRTGGDSDDKAVMAMTTIGLIFFILTFVMALIYMFIHKVNKNIVLILLAVFAFITVLFVLIGVIVFGQKYGDQRGTLNYSFAFACIAMILAAVAGVLSLVQMKNSGLCA